MNITIIEGFFILMGLCGFGFWFLSVFTSLGRGPAEFNLQKPVSFFDQDFMATMEGVSRTTFQYGGLPQILNNGDEFFPAILKDIKSAHHTIHIAVFILRPEEQIGKEVLSALMQKSKEGVSVKLLLDRTGSSKFTKKVQKKLEQAGIKIVIFRPLQFGILTRYHRRNHCRAFIIDGKIGYTGGAAFGQEWTGHAQNTHHWRDMMFRVTGNQARALQHVFNTLWTNQSGHMLAGNDVYPPITEESKESQWISLTGSPALETNLLRNMYWLSIMTAKKGIYVQNSYFFPSQYMRKAFIQKAQEGVEVILMLPNAHNDEKIIYYAGRSFYQELLLAGVKIYEFQPTMMHTKTFLADDCWALLGSANMDVRSEELNDENILGILSNDFGASMRQQFNADLQKCKEINLDIWQQRPMHEKVLEYICTLLGHQL